MNSQGRATIVCLQHEEMIATKVGGSTFRVPHTHGWLVSAGHCLEAQLDGGWEPWFLSTGASPHLLGFLQCIGTELQDSRAEVHGVVML